MQLADGVERKWDENGKTGLVDVKAEGGIKLRDDTISEWRRSSDQSRVETPSRVSSSDEKVLAWCNNGAKTLTICGLFSIKWLSNAGWHWWHSLE
jgi:hypothetical protein